MTRDKEDGGVPARLAALRERMRASGMDAYLVPSGDFHGSENMGEYFQCRAYITGFTGSAGTAAILPESAGLWTDGRYFVQAEAQLLGSGISLFKMGQEGVPDLEDYLAEQLPEGGVLGLDGRMADMLTVERLVEKLAPKRISLSFHADLAPAAFTQAAVDRAGAPGRRGGGGEAGGLKGGDPGKKRHGACADSFGRDCVAFESQGRRY